MLNNIKKNPGNENLSSWNLQNWITPVFVQINKIRDLGCIWKANYVIKRRSCRLSNMEAYVGNKATIMLMWDLNTRSHEITLRVFVLVSVFPVDVSVVFLFYFLI